jgi:hypothetical protein
MMLVLYASRYCALKRFWTLAVVNPPSELSKAPIPRRIAGRRRKRNA